MDNNRFYVYTWKVPVKNITFYVGKGTDSRSTNFHQSGRCENKRQKLLKTGFTNEQIVSIIQDNLTEEQALNLEEKLIKKFKRIEDGGTLLNYKVVNQKGFKILDPNILRTIINLYVNKKFTAKKIGEVVGLHETSVLRYLRISKIKTYSRGSRFKFTKDEINDIILMYSLGKSAKTISLKYNCSVPTICILLKNNNIKIRGKKRLNF